jgi:HAD superfamily hydrolase (TIGR01509 family)
MADDRSFAAVLLDIDGTLLDSNDAHARAWVETLARHGRPVRYERVRALIGKGGDKILATLLGIGDEEPLGRRLSEDRRRLFLGRYLRTLRPTPGARPLLERMRAEGLALVVATSASGDELAALLRQAGIDDLIASAATSSDAERSKPDPDIVGVALKRSGTTAARALMLGDTPYDIEAAARAGVATIALRCGRGWDDADLAGAIAIFDDPKALLAQWDRSPLARSGSTQASAQGS